jgi:hypothetical protein
MLLFRFTFNEKEHRLVRAQLDRRSPDLAQTPNGKIDHQAPDYSTSQAPEAITDET